MSRSRTVVRVVAILAVIGLVAWVTYQRAAGAPQEGEGGPPEDRGAPTVLVEELKPEERWETIQAAGTLAASEEIEVRTEVSGRIESIDIDEGEFIEEGQVILTLAPGEWRARLRAQETRSGPWATPSTSSARSA